MTLLEKIDRLKEEKHINNSRLSAMTGIPYTTIDSFYKKGYENMKLPTFIKLCDFFGVTMESMAYDDKDIEYVPAAPASSEGHIESRLIGAYRNASPDTKTAVCNVLGIKGEAAPLMEESI